MMEESINSGEFIFIKSVRDGIPNRDPLVDSDARRIFDEADGRISLSDVSIKRDVRDYLLAKFDGVVDHSNHVYVREVRTSKHELLGRHSLADKLRETVRADQRLSYEELLTRYAIDVRAFGVTFSVKGESFNLTGPIQITWAHSMHPVETRYVQGTVVLPSKDIDAKSLSGESEAKEQGTHWSSFILPFAVFVGEGVVNASIAKDTGLSGADVDLILEGLWRGTQHRQARGRGVQQPQLLLHVEYKNPFFRIGDLREDVTLEPGPQVWRSGERPSDIRDVRLNVTELAQVLELYRDKIYRCRLWQQPRLELTGELPNWIERFDEWEAA
jgi:CRISPR-associated protein Csh2